MDNRTPATKENDNGVKEPPATRPSREGSTKLANSGISSKKMDDEEVTRWQPKVNASPCSSSRLTDNPNQLVSDNARIDSGKDPVPLAVFSQLLESYIEQINMVKREQNFLNENTPVVEIFPKSMTEHERAMKETLDKVSDLYGRYIENMKEKKSQIEKAWCKLNERDKARTAKKWLTDAASDLVEQLKNFFEVLEIHSKELEMIMELK